MFFPAAGSIGQDDKREALQKHCTDNPEREALCLTTGLTPDPKEQVVASLHGQVPVAQLQ